MNPNHEHACGCEHTHEEESSLSFPSFRIRDESPVFYCNHGIQFLKGYILQRKNFLV